MSWKLFKSLVLDTLKNKTVLGTDADGTVIDGTTAADGRYIKLDASNSPVAVQFDTTITPLPSVPGLIQWNTVDGTYDMGLLNGSILQVGQETMFYGKASGAIANGDLCQFAGVQGDHILMKKAVGTEIESNPEYLIGVATQNIANGAYGYITWFGKINGVYTKTPNNQDSVDWVAGDVLYFCLATGQLTKVFPTAPNRVISVAAVVKAQTGASENGILLVRPHFGQKLEDLDDVNGTALTTDGQVPRWNNTAKYFDFDKNIIRQNYVRTNILPPTFSYTSGKLTNITYSDGTEKDFTYNLDGTLDTITVTYPDASAVVKTLVWSSGVLQSIGVA